MYTALKIVHIGAVTISGTGLLLRFALVGLNAPAVRRPFFRVAPHVIDTVLLASAVGLALLARLNPLVVPWLGAKIAVLPIYIVAGAAALRGTPRLRVPALALAIAAYCYIVGVAIAKHPVPWMLIL